MPWKPKNKARKRSALTRIVKKIYISATSPLLCCYCKKHCLDAQLVCLIHSIQQSLLKHSSVPAFTQISPLCTALLSNSERCHSALCAEASCEAQTCKRAQYCRYTPQWINPCAQFRQAHDGSEVVCCEHINPAYSNTSSQLARLHILFRSEPWKTHACLHRLTSSQTQRNL